MPKPIKPPKVIEVYRDASGKWRHHAISRNGQKTGAAEQGVVRRDYALERALTAADAFLPVLVPIVCVDARSGLRLNGRTLKGGS